MCLANTLQCLGHGITSLKWLDDRQASFCFKDTDQLKKIIELYWQDELLVEPKAFFNAHRLIKSRLYS